MPGRTLTRILACVATLVATLVAALVPGTGVAAARAGTATARAGTIAWHGCADGFQCGTLTVPLDDADPAGPTLDLAVIRKPAHERAARLGSLVFNPGGPGMSGADFLRASADTLPGVLRDRFDLVSFDPRGIGGSSPIDCLSSLDPLFDQSFSPADAAQHAGLEQAFRVVAAGCEARDGNLLAHVSTRDTVRDLERLRVALGEAQLNYLGYSYGTYLGAMYASTYPGHVGAFVLDGPVDPTLDGAQTTLSQARGFERALDDFLADCSSDPVCSFRHGGNAAAAYDALRARVARAPIAAADDSGRTLNQTRFDAAVLEQLYAGRPGRRSLERALTSAEEGNASTLLAVADTYVGRDATGHDDHSLEAFWAISCLDGPTVGDVAAATRLEAEATRIAPRLGAFVVNNSLACSVWPVPALATAGALTAAGAPPILVVGTTRDPATPFAQARALAGQLQRGVLLSVSGEQHTSFDSGNRCVDRAVTRFLVSREAPANGTRC